MAEPTHGPDCPCTRCAGFQPANTLAERHGAYGLLALKPRAEEIAETIREAMDKFYASRFEGAIAGAAMTGAQLERAHEALLEAKTASDVRRLEQDARGWMRLWLQSLGMLGLTPMSAAKLGLTIAQTGDELKRYLEQREREQRERADASGEDAKT